MSTPPLQPATLAVHAGTRKPRIGGASVLPIFQATVFEQSDISDYRDLRYPRLNNLPNQLAVAEKIAALEQTEAALVTASGMAAITTTLLAVLGDGGHLLAQRNLYGGTYTFLRDDIARFGMSFGSIDANDPATWDDLVQDSTRAIYVEAIANPNLTVADHSAIVDFAQRHGLVSIIDNTFATPINFQPAVLGYDIVLHSATKYLNGHSDLAAGAIASSSQHLDKILPLLNHLGGSMDPHACFLLDRGLKTLPLRVERQNANSLAIVEHLQLHPRIRRVFHPSLPECLGHDVAKELFRGYGGMVTFEVDSDGAGTAEFLHRLQLPLNAPSLGGVESNATRPVTTSHLALTQAERATANVTDSMVRFSVGIEAAEDLIADLDQALDPA